MDTLNPDQLQNLIQQGVTLGVPLALNVLKVVFIFIVGRWIAGKLADVTARSMTAGNVDATLTNFASSGVRYLILGVTVLAVLNVFGVETTSLVAVLGAAGFAVGLALQGSLSNFSAGVMLLLFRPFSVGDVVTAGGVTGGVQQIGLFNTVLKTPDAVVITVPNGQVFGSVISNMTSEDMRRVDVGIGVAYDADPRSAKKLLIEAVDGVFGVLSEQGTDAYLIELGASSVDFQIRAWCKPADYWAVREQILIQGKLALDDAGIGIPYQTLDLNIVSSPLPGNVSQLITGSNMRPASERSA
jgi:small conductance mechanosensitive channel